MNCIFALKRLIIYIRSKIRNYLNGSYGHILQTLNNTTSKEILIVGSGPAAEKLKDIKIRTGVTIFATNRSIFNLKQDSKIYLYTTTTFSLDEAKETLSDRVKNYKVKNIISNKKIICKGHRVITYEFDDTYFQERIVESDFLTLLIKYFKYLCKGYHLHPSQGILLVILALLTKPSKIYTIGINAPKYIKYSTYSGYNKIDSSKTNFHYFVDRIVLEKFNNKIFKLDKLSKDDIKKVLT